MTNQAFQEYSSDVIVHHSEEDYKKLVKLVNFLGKIKSVLLDQVAEVAFK